MVAPSSGPAVVQPNKDGSTSRDEKRRQILEDFMTAALRARQDGNKMCKRRHPDFHAALICYSKALHMLEKVPLKMSGTHLVKLLGNRAEVYIQVEDFTSAEEDVTKALSIDCSDNETTAELLSARFRARTKLGNFKEAQEDLLSVSRLRKGKALRENGVHERRQSDGNGAEKDGEDEEQDDAARVGGASVEARASVSNGGSNGCEMLEGQQVAGKTREKEQHGSEGGGENGGVIADDTSCEAKEKSDAGARGDGVPDAETPKPPDASTQEKVTSRFITQIGGELTFGGPRRPCPWSGYASLDAICCSLKHNRGAILSEIGRRRENSDMQQGSSRPRRRRCRARSPGTIPNGDVLPVLKPPGAPEDVDCPRAQSLIGCDPVDGCMAVTPVTTASADRSEKDFVRINGHGPASYGKHPGDDESALASSRVTGEARADGYQTAFAVPNAPGVGENGWKPPPPSRQAQEIRWLVEDATKAKYTGCDQDAPSKATNDDTNGAPDGSRGEGANDSDGLDGEERAQVPCKPRPTSSLCTENGSDGSARGIGAAGLANGNCADSSPAPHPGPIDNSALVMERSAPGTFAGSGRRLRIHLTRGYHFVLVPQEAWFAMRTWYGGGPPLPRRVVESRDPETGKAIFEPQLYPEFSRSDPMLRSTLDLSKIGGSLPATSPVTPSRPPPPQGDPTHARHNGLTPECFNRGGSAVSHNRVVTHAPHAVGVGEDGAAHGATDSRDVEGKRVEAVVASTVGSRAEHAGRRPPSEDARLGNESARNSCPTRKEACASCGRMTSRVCSSCLQAFSRVHYCARGCQAAHWKFHKRFCGGREGRAALGRAKRGKAGVTNVGNTCFLGSALQCLSHVRPLTQHILSNQFKKDVNLNNPLGTGGRLVHEYAYILKELWFGASSTVSPLGLKNAIARFAPQFTGNSQHDSQEVLSFLLDGLHEDLNRVQQKPYVVLPEGESMPDEVLAAESWELFAKRDRSVLVDNLYGQFKSTLECQECGKVSRKFDVFNVMPVELLAGVRQVITVDFAPILKPDAAAKATASGSLGAGPAPPRHALENGFLGKAAWILGGEGKEGRKPRRIGVAVPRHVLIFDLKVELAQMFEVAVEALVVVAVPTTGPLVYTVAPDAAEVWRYAGQHEITVHEVVPGMRHALVVNRVFGSQDTRTEEVEGRRERWEEEVKALSCVRHQDKDGAFMVSFPADISCLGLMELVASYARDFFVLDEGDEDDKDGGYSPKYLAESGQVKLSDARDWFAPIYLTTTTEKPIYLREKADELSGVLSTELGRYIPPASDLLAAAVLDTSGGTEASGLDFLRMDWSGRLLEKMDVKRVYKPYGIHDHRSVLEAERQSKRVSLQECLEKFSLPEMLSEDNSWFCGGCKHLRPALKTLEVWTLPEILILHFKRFSQRGQTRRKVDLFVDFPIDGLDMSRYCLGGRLEGGRPIPAVFDLFAVSNHMGVIGNGHYTALVRDWDGDGMSKNWYACDDDHCQPVSEDRVKTSNAYVLFYRRRPPCSR